MATKLRCFSRSHPHRVREILSTLGANVKRLPPLPLRRWRRWETHHVAEIKHGHAVGGAGVELDLAVWHRGATASPGRRSKASRTIVGRSMNTCAIVQPRTDAMPSQMPRPDPPNRRPHLTRLKPCSQTLPTPSRTAARQILTHRNESDHLKNDTL
jgi:hypothetical protein